jgi:beta-N-acetylhexosaminidase
VGVIFFADNITSREQVHALTHELQVEARDLDMPPLLIAADQEGGIVSRFSQDFVTVPSAMALAASGAPGDIMTAATITAVQLREVGINVNFAPSVDVNNNPANPVIRTRSYGDTPERVIDSLEWVFRGHEAARVVSTVKHFPGHGDTNVDSHFGLPTIPYERDRIDAIELAPFRAAAALGIPAVMSTHILFPALDPVHPATLSNAILTGLLREEMEFEGLIFTDAMDMHAITSAYGLEEATVLAKLAGVDVLEANEPIADQLLRHAALVNALESGRIPRTMFETTSDRLDQVRARYAITGQPTPLPEKPANRWDITFDIALRTIAHVGPKPFVPLDRESGHVFVDFQRFRAVEGGDPVGRSKLLRDEVEANLPHSTVVTLSDQPTSDEIASATTHAVDASTLIVLTRDATESPHQLDIARQAIAATPGDTRVIHCPMRGPYDAGLLGDVDDFLFAFGDPAISIRALVAILCGLHQPVARIPVTVPGLA